MFNKDIKIGKIFGIPIEINLSWFVIFLLIAWSLASGYFPHFYPSLDKFLYWAMGVIASILLFASVLLHELMHSLVGRKNGIGIKKITLFIFGGIAHMSEEAPNPKAEFKMAIAGPITSIALSAIFYTVAYFMEISGGVWIPALAVIRYIALLNGILAGFNLIPGFPLDGGRVLRSIIWSKTKNLKMATSITSKIGRGFAYILVGFGFFNILLMRNFVGGVWLIFIGFFLQQAAQIGYLQVSLKEALSGLSVADIMREEVVNIEESTSLEDTVNNYFFKYRYNSFPVVKDGRLTGIITLQQVKKVERDKWSLVRIYDIMDKNIQKFTVTPFEEAAKVVNKIVKDGIGRVIVIDENNNLKGVLTHGDIVRIFKIRTDLGD